MPLPEHASEASQKRYEIALRLAQSCPPKLADEIALTGSTARGLADDESDLELNLWSEPIPSVEARVAWLEAAGVEQIRVFEKPRKDLSYWIGGRVGDIPLEVGWQTYETVEGMVERLLLGHEELAYGDILTQAIPLRTQGKLDVWQKRLNAYPQDLKAQIIQTAIRFWVDDGHVVGMCKLARRGERLLLAEFLTDNLAVMMAVLYTINGRWQPSRKWTLTVARELPLMPENWRERIDVILTAQPIDSVRLCCGLLLDALALVPPEFNVSATVEGLRDA